MDVNPALIAGPIGLAVLILLIFGWRKEMFGRKKKAEAAALAKARDIPVPEGDALIATEAVGGVTRLPLVHALMLVAIGTFGWEELLRVLTLLAQCGLGALVGSLLVVENDEKLRNQFQAKLPAVFRDRVVYGSSPAFGGGFGNRPVAWVLSCIGVWGRPILRAVDAVIYKHLSVTNNGTPSQILLFQSLGGQAPIGIPVLKALHTRFEEALILAFTAIPRHGRLRQRFEQLKPHYDECGCAGWVPSDNLGQDPTTQDYGMAALIVALCEASLHADQTTELGNAFSLALPEERGAILRFDLVAASLAAFPFQPHPLLPLRYRVGFSAVAQEGYKALQLLEQGRGLPSVELPADEPETSTFDILIAPVGHEDLTRIADEILASRVLGAEYDQGSVQNTNGKHASEFRLGKENHELLFASIPAVIDPARPACPLVALRLRALRRNVGLVHQLVKAPQARLLPLPTPLLPSGNPPAAEVIPQQPVAAQEPDRPVVVSEAPADDEALQPDAEQENTPAGEALSETEAGSSRTPAIHRRYQLRPSGHKRIRRVKRYDNLA